MLSIAYMTCRKEPRIEWFLDSLKAQGGFAADVEIIVVDFWGETLKTIAKHLNVEPTFEEKEGEFTGSFIRTVTPMPNVWNGSYRLPKENWFAASAARNTAICHAKGDYLVFVDDLSVLLPGWLDAVREAVAGKYCVYGAYRKVMGLVVESGVPVYYNHSNISDDSRRHLGSVNGPVPAIPSMLYGCSFGCPMEAYLQVNGFNQAADGLGGEDSLFGICLGKKGWPTMYDLRMGTLESEEDHHKEPPFIRRDKGKSPFDKSHAILDMVLRGDGVSPNYFPPGGIRALRESILNGGRFPMDQNPQHDWYDGQRIAEMT